VPNCRRTRVRGRLVNYRWVQRLRPVLAVVCLALACLSFRPGASLADPVPPPHFSDQLVTSFIGPTDLAFTPDGRMVITKKSGIVFVYKNGTLLPAALNIEASTCTDTERGMLGITVDPDFATKHYIYIYYTYKKEGSCETYNANKPVNRVSRFTLANNDTINPASELVLIDNIPSYSGSHNAGGVGFGKDGYLYVSVGDGFCDYVQDSGCGFGNDAARDTAALTGKILRITKDGGIPATNPFQGPNDVRCNVTGRTTIPQQCQEIYAWGLRNPFRIAFDSNDPLTKLYINDVGQDKREEIDLGQAGANYGWNIREANCWAGTTDCGPLPPGWALTEPIYQYAHDAAGCNAITAGAFVPIGIWPAQFDGAYLYTDLTCGKLFRLVPGGGGTFTAAEVMSGITYPISATFGPYGSTQALYYISWTGTPGNPDQIRRLAFTGQANRPPVASATANPTHGSLPLNVSFNGTGSSDPDNDPLTYDWDFGDGSAHGSGATTSHTYTTRGVYTVTLTVSDGQGLENQTTLQIDADNDAPVPVIDTPLPSKLFRVGESITLEGHATDPEDGPLPESALTFEVIKRHDTHFHPYFPPTQGDEFTITAPEPEDINSTQNSYLEIILTATDSNGLSTTIRQALRPRLVDTTFESSPSGLKLQVAGSTITAPQTIVSWDGWNLAVNTWNQATSNGAPYDFSSWSDGGERSHTITTPPAASTYLATFAPGGYARPLAATPETFQFVPAYRTCSAGDMTHNDPLNLPSCSAPAQESDSLTLGGPETTGFAAAGTGMATLKVFCTDGVPPPCRTAGDTEDVSIRAAITDVHCRDIAACPGGGLAGDYTGRLLVTTNIRITDRLTGVFGNAAGTSTDQPIGIPIDCAATPTELSVGSNCNVETTFETLYPGLVREQSRAVWELGPLAILDSGANGTGFGGNCPPTCGDGDEQVFMRQGLFAP
jgi:hypothetical protein